jgi:16S rRNA (uracil1498-N3)-methyltransferase
MKDWMFAEPWVLMDRLELSPGDQTELGHDEARHVKSSLRRRQGERLVLCDGAGTLARAEIGFLQGDRATVEILEVASVPRPRGRGIAIALSVLHSRAMDWAVQKSVETGAARFIPLISARSQLDRRVCLARSEHWKRLAMQSCKQCRRAWFMELADVHTLVELIERQSPPCVLAHREGGVLAELPNEEISTLLIGPEGGFTRDEEQQMERAGWWRLRLGEHVLRAETAATVGSAVLVRRNGEVLSQGEKNQ